MVVVSKKDGRIRVCVDPKPLNQALKRNHYPLPTIEDVLPQLAKAKYFTVLDAKNGFWHVTLDEASSYATTFGTPWGRFRWLRMPFGIAPAPEEFQRRLDQVLVGLKGCKAIADDILVVGCGETAREAREDHDTNLRNVLQRCREKGVKLNGGKVQLRCKEVSYMGHTLTSEGLKPDANKIKAVEEMPVPTDKQAVQRLLGMTNYLQRFASAKLAEVTNPLRELVKKENEFVWEEHVHGQALAEVRRILTAAPVLRYFDPAITPVLQCDASMHGLGACLMQDGQPVAYASRALTNIEVNYAQIEKELLAIVFGMEKFETYLYGRKVLVESDHKPLETIFRKSLLSAPKRLQRMLLRLQRYDFTVMYKKGTQIVLADALSRAFLPCTEEIRDGEQGGQVLAISDVRSPSEIAVEQINMLQDLAVEEDTFQKIRHCTQETAELKVLEQVIKQGWPETRKEIPWQIQKYATFREELSVQDGIIFKGERMVIPPALRKEFVKKIHASHLGTQACLRRAREVWYWPNMSKEIAEFVSECAICKTYSQDQQKEPMIAYPVPSRPWEVIGTDLFEFRGRDYLVTTDYYSNFFEVDRLYNKTAKEVIGKLKAQLARHGIPEKVVSDNGPQFTSDEFKKFADVYEFRHSTSSPGYPQSNGKAENAVKTAKRIMEKALAAGGDPYLGFLDFRNTPTEGLETSPAQRLFGRRTKTLAPTAKKLLKVENNSSTMKQMRNNKRKQLSYYNRATRSLKPLLNGDTVFVRPAKNRKEWTKATVDKPMGIRSYAVTTHQGSNIRRNRRHLRLAKEVEPPKSPVCDSESELQEVEQRPQTTEDTTDFAMNTTNPQSVPLDQGENGKSPERYSSRGRRLRKPAYLEDYVY